MTSYGSNSSAQILAFGAINSSLDTKTIQCRAVATSIINASLNLERDIESPSDAIDNCCNMISSAILRAKPGQANQDENFEIGMKLLEKLRGDSESDAPWRINIPVERFRGLIAVEDIRPHNFVA